MLLTGPNQNTLRLASFGVLSGAILLLLIHAAYYYPFLSDDSLITFRYVERLVQGKGLTWSDGHRVEGYSNLLWLLLLAPFGALGIDLVIAARALGLLCMSLVIVITGGWYLKREYSWQALLAIAVGLLFFTGVAPVAVWAIGGLEQPLLAIILTGSILLYWDELKNNFATSHTTNWLSLLLGLLCLVRPDGALFTLAFLASYFVSSLDARRQVSRGYIIRLLLFPALFYAGQTLFRLRYYGEWVPNTALVKLSPSVHHLQSGIAYVLHGFRSLFPASLLSLLFLITGLRNKPSRGIFVAFLIIPLFWTTYLIVIGGDLFPAQRHFIPLVVAMLFILTEGMLLISSCKHLSKPKRLLINWVSIVGMASTLLLQFNVPSNIEAKTERWEWDCKALATTLKEAFSTQQPRIAVTAAGCLPYWSGLPSLDMLGLNDYYLPRHKPTSFGEGFIGHELGDGNYILEQSPDLIIFHTGTDPVKILKVGAELSESRTFIDQYAKVRLKTSVPPYFIGTLWINKNSTKVGYKKSAEGLNIPGYLLNAFEDTTARLRDKQLAVEITKDHPVGVVIHKQKGIRDIKIESEMADLVLHEMTQSQDEIQIILSTQSQIPVLIKSITLLDGPQ